MAALELADNPQAAADNRRITEHDPAMARLKARTARQLAASIQQLVDDLNHGVQPVQAQSHFIDRHLAILRAAYLAAHTEGQRQFYDAVSNTPQKWAKHEADTATMQRRMAFYAPSVAKMAHEAVRAFQTVTHELHEPVTLSNPYPRQRGGRWGFGGEHGTHESGIARHAQMTKERTQAQRAENAKAGLNARGGKYSYNGYVRAVSRAEKSGDHETAAKLKKMYPEHEAYRKAGGKPDEHQTPGARAARARAHFQATRQYRREDILSGDHTFKSEKSYSQLMAHALRTHDHAMVRAMVRNYSEHWNRLQARMPQLTKPVRAAFKSTTVATQGA